MSFICPLCLRALLRLTSFTQPLVADSPWTYSRFRSNIPYTCSRATSSRPRAFLILTPGLTQAFSFSRRPTGLDYDHFCPLPYCAYLTVMTTSRTHCHFVKQTRALRVLEVCVHIFVPTHIAACFCISLWCLRLSTSVL